MKTRDGVVEWGIASWSEYKDDLDFRENEENESGGSYGPVPIEWGEDEEEVLSTRGEVRRAESIMKRRRELVARVDAKRRLLRSFRVEKSEH